MYKKDVILTYSTLALEHQKILAIFALKLIDMVDTLQNFVCENYKREEIFSDVSYERLMKVTEDLYSIKNNIIGQVLIGSIKTIEDTKIKGFIEKIAESPYIPMYKD